MATTSVREKTLKLNQTLGIYGSFAEIGAGQETSRWFFRTPGASNTVAKAMSAYDMAFSDTIYGKEPTGRYVCEARLMKMLDHEYTLVERRLGPTTGKTTRYFAFANTVAARSKATRGRGHGWLGIKWQTSPEAAPCEIRLHVQLLDGRNTLQQEALGAVGVNLTYGAFFLKTPEEVIKSLADDLEKDRVQIDFIAWDTPEGGPDPRQLQFFLLKHGLTPAVAMDQRGFPQQLGELTFGKKPLLFQSDYKPVSYYQIDLLQCAQEQILKDEGKGKPVLGMALLAESDPNFSEADYHTRIKLLSLMDLPSVVTRDLSVSELLHVLELNNIQEPHVLLTPEELRRIMQSQDHPESPGGLLGVMGELFHSGMKFYLCPTLTDGKVEDIDNFQAPGLTQNLFAYFRDLGFFRGTKCLNQEHLKITGEQIVSEVRAGKKEWKEKVPPAVAAYIEENEVF